MNKEEPLSPQKKSKIKGYFIERRKHYRISKEIKVKYKFLSQVADIQPSEMFEGITNNISTTGVLLKGQIPAQQLLEEMMLQNVMLYLEIYLPKKEIPVKATAQVRWAESKDASKNLYYLGLKFTDITAEDKNILTQFILDNI